MEVPFALSISKFVNSVGADVGFAAFIAVAILAVLYFAQARETATLRDRLDEAHDRIGGLEARVAQLLHLQARQQGAPAAAPQQTRVAPAVTPPPAAVRPMGSAIASVRRVPSAAATAAAAASSQGGVATMPAAPAGMGAPALASATKLIPDPALAAPAATGEDTTVVPGAPSNGHSELPVAPATTATAAAAARRGAPTIPPPVQIRPEGSGAGPIPRRTTTQARPRPEERFEVFDHHDGGGLLSSIQGRLAPLGIAVIAVLVIAIGGVVISTSGNGTPAPIVHSPNGAAPSKQATTLNTSHQPTAPVFNPATVTVAVLNGTDVSGLAADVGTDLGKAGYKQGNITNAATQSQPTTIVYYRPKFRAAAFKVAASLKLGHKSVQAATQQALQSCATTPTAATTSCVGDVIVAVGADRKSLAPGSSSSAG